MQTKASLTLTEQDIKQIDKFLGKNTSQQMQGEKTQIQDIQIWLKNETL